MKTLLSICLAAIIMSACGSKTGKNATEGDTSAVSTSTPQPLTNPAHGMPGHDCAIPEGAPLPQKGTAQPQVQNTAPAQTEVKNIPMEVKQPVKLNPAHGLPGHRCDIAEGAPLS